MNLFAVDFQRAGNAGAVAAAEQAHGKLGTPGAHQAGDADHLALAHMEGDVVDDLFVRVKRMIDGPVADVEGNIADFHTAALREAVFHLAADHAADDAVFADIILALGQSLDGPAVTHDGDVVRDIGNLVDLVRDDDRGHALLLELEKQIQQRLRVLFIQGRGRLVQNHQLRMLCEGLGNFDHLLFADADVLDQRFR